ncbi:signal recognition particle SRP19 subunit [Dacryopinax primogenitus]|uniref:Signal recognition particle SRP19 subunit n=1 Tax=Dacryopinax primogenitus (strain DJM 731) TaxID=1858805 RepID=M5FQW3_DACPD|nr:signal recognition particle SRP19 subunit [Dacryopinax primogenitus]EJT99380.1 signal recognition particle SRP19 subunit [Dacryopinax primogenitus]
MPPRAFIEEEFDDDTDLPLPTHSLPNTGTRGPLLQEIDSEEDEDVADEDDEEEYDPREEVIASGSGSRTSVPAQQQSGKGPLMNRETTKTWTTLYPIYIDAKRPLHKNERRIPRAKSVWWPLSSDMGEACARLGFNTLHDQGKRHPKDWENPGRVKVQFKKDGRLVNPSIPTKKKLLLHVAAYVQSKRPQFVPTPESLVPRKNARGMTKVPLPPSPAPAIPQRLPANSPIVETGMLVESMKQTLANEKTQQAQAQVEGTGGKGKRKVIRVRA